MQEEKIEIIPIRAVFPAFKDLKKHEQTGFGSGVNMSGESLLLAPNSDRFNVPLMRSTQRWYPGTSFPLA